MTNPSQPMTWLTFRSRLEENPELPLRFEYAAGSFVDRSFHITEIKQAPITSVDCGGVVNKWTEVIMQLWEPQVSDAEHPMLAGKALKIIELVEKSLPLQPNASVKIEFGNSKFDTRQMYPGELLAEGDSLTVKLVPDFTQCKALARDQACGTSKPCCGPDKEEPELPVTDGAACKPDSGCC